MWNAFAAAAMILVLVLPVVGAGSPTHTGALAQLIERPLGLIPREEVATRFLDSLLLAARDFLRTGGKLK